VGPINYAPDSSRISHLNSNRHALRHNAVSRIMPSGVVEGLYLSVFPLLLV